MIISLETITLESTQLFTLLGLRLVTQTHQANTHIYYLIYLLKSFPPNEERALYRYSKN